MKRGGSDGEISESGGAHIERDSLLGVHRALFTSNVDLDYVHIDHLSPNLLSQYKLVVFPYPVMLPEKAAPALRQYVENGGALVSEARLGWNNERGYASDRIPGMGLWEVMGCRESAIQTGANGRTTLRWTGAVFPGMKGGEELPGRWYEETLEPITPGAKVVAQFANGGPAAVLSRFGKGKTLMLGSYLSAAYQTTPKPELRRFYEALLTWAGVDSPVRVTSGNVEVRALHTGADRLVFAFNHSSDPVEADFAIRAPVNLNAAFDLVADRPAEAQRDAGYLHFRRKLGPSDVWVVKLSPSQTGRVHPVPSLPHP